MFNKKTFLSLFCTSYIEATQGCDLERKRVVYIRYLLSLAEMRGFLFFGLQKSYLIK